ncbi:hypothetical protein DFH06DRAFT_1229113 [Mycena polygramma]|nr:hypothetical protein DFH06DRAFT_1229113 [Mycena polygramma]
MNIFQRLFLAALRIQIVKYVHVASLAVLLYDYCLTLHLEVDLIWPSKWSLTKALFFLSRYSVAVDAPLLVYYAVARDISIQRCHQIHTVATWLNLAGFAFTEGIFVVRTFALSGRDRKVLAVFTTICVGSLLTSAVLIAELNRTVTFGPPLLPTLPGCFLTGGTLKYVAIPYILALLIDTCVVVFTTWIVIKNYRNSDNPFIITMYRDGIMYFAFLCAISAVNVFVILGGPPEMPELLENLMRVMHSILSTRVLLHIREVEHKRFLEADISTRSQIHFRGQESSGI